MGVGGEAVAVEVETGTGIHAGDTGFVQVGLKMLILNHQRRVRKCVSQDLQSGGAES